MQYDIELSAQENQQFKFVFGACKGQLEEVAEIRETATLNNEQRRLKQVTLNIKTIFSSHSKVLALESEDDALDQFVNHWLPRQVFYHGDSNRLTTDPQTRNYLQDAMGMCFIAPEKTKQALLTTLSQQKRDGCLA